MVQFFKCCRSLRLLSLNIAQRFLLLPVRFQFTYKRIPTFLQRIPFPLCLFKAAVGIRQFLLPRFQLLVLRELNLQPVQLRPDCRYFILLVQLC